MARDETPTQRVESILHAAGVADSGALAEAIVAEVMPDPLTPTEGAMDDREHMGFILRIFMHYIELTPNKQLSVDLNQVLKSTVGRQMQVKLNGATFEARTIAGPIPNQKRHLLI